mgnify:FL=1
MSFKQNSARFQILTVNALTGRTYWQQPQDTAEDAERHASRYTKNVADWFIYNVSYGSSITLIKTILHKREE